MTTAREGKSPVKLAREGAYRVLVLDAAERVFAAKGFDGAKIKDVADEAGLALGTVYTIFPGKHDVFIAVHERRGGELLRAVIAVLADEVDPVSSLAQGITTICRFYGEHPDYLRMHFSSGTSWASPRLDVSEEQTVYLSGRAPLVALFERAAARGDRMPETAETSASLLLASIQVFFAEWIAESFATPPDALAARIDRYVRRALLDRGAAG